jgi:prepilin-type N-terminal cleavage/methylation domain-containing protein
MIRRPEPEDRDDRGFTIIEMVVSMAIMSIVMTIMTAAVAQIYSAANRVDSTSFNRSQLTLAFRRLDTEMRYATWIGTATPTPVGNSYYVEYAIGTDGCRELKFDTSAGVLSLYSWTLPSNTPANPVALASNVRVMSGPVPPFFTQGVGTFPFATATSDTIGLGKAYSPQFAQLRVRFNAVTGKTTVPFDTIYTAENTAANTAASNTCSKGRPTS